LSQLAEARRLPSGLKATPQTVPVCPWRVSHDLGGQLRRVVHGVEGVGPSRDKL
jgi:hypothetical protein